MTLEVRREGFLAPVAAPGHRRTVLSGGPGDNDDDDGETPIGDPPDDDVDGNDRDDEDDDDDDEDPLHARHIAPQHRHGVRIAAQWRP